MGRRWEYYHTTMMVDGTYYHGGGADLDGKGRAGAVRNGVRARQPLGIGGVCCIHALKELIQVCEDELADRRGADDGAIVSPPK